MTTKINTDRLRTCEDCGGSGDLMCGSCSGSGVSRFGARPDDYGPHYVCSECDGRGDVECDTCAGCGEVEEDLDDDPCDGFSGAMDELESIAKTVSTTGKSFDHMAAAVSFKQGLTLARAIVAKWSHRHGKRRYW